MFTQFFGHFLLNHNILDSEQMKNVFDNLKNTRLKLGMIAINEGYLTLKQVEKINHLQWQYDKRFGEIAVEYDYLSEEQLATILTKQQSEYLLLAQTIVNLGYLSMEEYIESINMYKRLYSISDEAFEGLKDGKVEELINPVLKDVDSEIKTYVTLFYKNIIRFITNDVYIGEVNMIEQGKDYNFIFEQNMNGDFNLYSGYSADDNSIVRFSSLFAKEELNSIDDYTIDVCKEFLNMHNGLFSVNMSDRNVKLNLELQNSRENCTLDSCNGMYSIPFHTNIGDLELIVGYYSI